MKGHLRQHGRLPTSDTIRSNGFALDVLTEEPATYWAQRLSDREIHCHVTNYQKQISRVLAANGSMVDITRILREQLAAVLSVKREAQFSTYGGLAREVLADALAARANPGALIGLPLGYDSLNASTGGLLAGELYVIVGRPGVGKTAALMEAFHQNFDFGSRSLICSNEMPGKQLVRRLLGRRSGINHLTLKTGDIGTLAEGCLHRAISDIENGPETHFIAGNFDQTTSALEQMVAQFRPDILFVDAAYLLKVSGMARASATEKQEQVVRDMKALLMQYGIPGCMTFQLNRDEKDKSQGKKHRVDLSSIGGTDAVGKDADVIQAMIRAPQPYSRTHRILQGIKARDSDPTDVAIRFQFYPPDYSEIPLEEIMGNSDDDEETTDQAANDINAML